MREPTPTYARARRWTAHLTAENDGSDEIAVYCPQCDEREFGDTE
jgi:hypothetical protein